MSIYSEFYHEKSGSLSCLFKLKIEGYGMLSEIAEILEIKDRSRSSLFDMKLLSSSGTSFQLGSDLMNFYYYSSVEGIGIS